VETTCQHGLFNHDNSETEENEPNIQDLLPQTMHVSCFFANHDTPARRRFLPEATLAKLLFNALLNLSNVSGQS